MESNEKKELNEIKDSNENNVEKIWDDEEQKYLNMLCIKYDEMAEKYMKLYRYMHSKQIRYRLPVIIFSSLSGIASFGTTSFPIYMQRYVSIGVGIVNVCISIIQAYESYIKLNDIVVKSYVISSSLKKLSDRIHVELYIPINKRLLDGDKYLRAVLEEYEKIMADAPPLEYDNKSEFFLMHKDISSEIEQNYNHINKNIDIVQKNISSEIQQTYNHINKNINITEENQKIKNGTRYNII
jgi:hypothetical protein